MTDNPEMEALNAAVAALSKGLRGHGINTVTRSQVKEIAMAMLHEFVSVRAFAWAKQRGGPLPFDSPDAHDVGFARAALQSVKSKAIKHELPLEKALKDWAPQQVAMFLAIGSVALEETRLRTLEDPVERIPI